MTSCRTRYPILLVHGLAGRDAGRLPYWGAFRNASARRGLGPPCRDRGLRYHRGEREAARRQDRGDPRDRRRSGEHRGPLHGRTRFPALHILPGRRTARGLPVHLNTPIAARPWRASFLEVLPVRPGRSRPSSTSPLARRTERTTPRPWRPRASSAGRPARPSTKPNPDDPEVYYRSYASRIDGTFPVRRKAALWKLLYEREGENDGLVSVESARWGDFKGVVGAEAAPRSRTTTSTTCASSGAPRPSTPGLLRRGGRRFGAFGDPNQVRKWFE